MDEINSWIAELDCALACRRWTWAANALVQLGVEKHGSCSCELVDLRGLSFDPLRWIHENHNAYNALVGRAIVTNADAKKNLIRLLRADLKTNNKSLRGYGNMCLHTYNRNVLIPFLEGC
jgi:hypothetical protein